MSEPNWEALDAILRPIDQLILDEAARRNIPIGRRNHSTWRWDEPETSIRWIGPDGISRNVVGYIDGERGNYQVKIECNAWIDSHQGQRSDPNRARKWEYQEIAWIDPHARDQVKQVIVDAFNAVMLWTYNDLERTTDISTIPDISSEQSDAQRAMEERENQARLNAIADRLMLKD